MTRAKRQGRSGGSSVVVCGLKSRDPKFLAALGQMFKAAELRGLHEALASFLMRWAKHTSYIHDMDCDCRAFEKQARLFIKELRPRRERSAEHG